MSSPPTNNMSSTNETEQPLTHYNYDKEALGEVTLVDTEAYNEILPEWRATDWKHSLFDCGRTNAAICLESYFCICCAVQKIDNVFSNRLEWSEEDSSIGCPCFLAGLLTVYPVISCIFPFYGELRIKVMNRYHIGTEPDACNSCLIGICCRFCSVNQIYLEMTSHGEFPGGVACAKRPADCPERPPPPPEKILTVAKIQTKIDEFNKFAQDRNGHLSGHMQRRLDILKVQYSMAQEREAEEQKRNAQKFEEQNAALPPPPPVPIVFMNE